MSDHSSPEAAHGDSLHYEYRVRALFPTGGKHGEPVEMSTEWTHSRDIAISNAEAMQDTASHVEIESRPYHTTIDVEEVPE